MVAIDLVADPLETVSVVVALSAAPEPLEHDVSGDVPRVELRAALLALLEHCLDAHVEMGRAIFNDRFPFAEIELRSRDEIAPAILGLVAPLLEYRQGNSRPLGLGLGLGPWNKPACGLGLWRRRCRRA